MKRIQLFEFEDFRWFPGIFRDGITRLIQVLHRMMGTAELLSDLILMARKKHGFDQIVDVGSGAGGAMPEVCRIINANKQEKALKVLLTDLYPEESYIKQVKSLNLPNLAYHENPVDALDMENSPGGLKTMINSFHHMPPEKAREILHSAASSKQPLFIYELTENKIPTLAWWVFLPVSLVIMIIMVLFMTPFVRPLTWKQLLFTYLIPIIPLAYAWDGQASNVRTYTIKDFGQLLKGIKEDNYVWEIAPAKKRNGKELGYFVFGRPEDTLKEAY
jgi:hypothetical protein